MTGIRVLVCGGRNFRDKAMLYGRLNAMYAARGVSALIHGGARGADFLASGWAIANEVPSIAFPADWKRLGDAAGPIRNSQMLREGKPDLVLAFPSDGPGTANCIEQAMRYQIAVMPAPAEDSTA